jgi:pimeloyl-ACP methyl ester carboxylesterase
MRRFITTVTAAGLIGAGLAAGPAGAQAKSSTTARAAASTADYTPPPIVWGTCPTGSLQRAGAQCGMLVVPLDYSKPTGTTIQLAVSRIMHKTSDADAQGVMLVNPGGPGASGLGLARLGAFVPNGGGDPYDWIGFDPRGVGRSVPSLACDDDYFAPGRPPYVPDTNAIERAWFAKTRQYARDCGSAAASILLAHTKSTDWAMDMESIRKALGANQINYYGFSYGTYLGQVYSTLFPNRVRRFVLDGVVNPTRVWYDANLDQDAQFDRNIHTFFDWVADNNAAYHLGTNGAALTAKYYEIRDQLTEHPVGSFGAAEWNDVFVGAGYYVYDWDTYAHIFAAAVNGDLGPARDWYDDPTGPGSDNTYANYLAVQCTDVQWPQGWGTWKNDNWALNDRYPFLTWNNAWYNAPCRYWPAKAGTPVNVNGAGVPGILLIAETNDAATPFGGALEVRRRYPHAVLIEGVGGTTHAGSLSGVSCTDERIADYLLTGALPTRLSGNRSDVQCEPVPPPDATPVAAAAARTLAPQTAGQSRDRLPADLRQMLSKAAPAR